MNSIKKILAGLVIIALAFSFVGYCDSIIDKYVGVESEG